MNAATKDVSILVQSLTDARTALEKRRADLLAEVATIEQALGVTSTAPAPKPSKGPRTPHATGIGEAIIQFVRLRPASTIREIQTGFPDAKPASIEATVRNLAARGMLAKDNETPRHFSIPEAPAESSELSPTPARSPEQAKNGAARPQQQPSPKG